MRKVLAFMPLESEPDITGLFPQCLAAGRISGPAVRSGCGQLPGLPGVTGPGDSTCPGRYGCWNLSPSVPLLLKELDFALVPGIGFSLNGRRLGRGKGYFDRMLCEVRGWKCGVAFDWQVAVEIPSEQHDIHAIAL